MFASEDYRPKKKAGVQLLLHDGSELSGSLFLLANQRIVDIVNDPRMFVPFMRSDGTVIVLNKSAIMQIVPREQKTEPASVDVLYDDGQTGETKSE